MSPTPLYSPTPDGGAYQLRYSWTGWASAGQFARQPVELIEQAKSAWETDSMRVLEYRWTAELVQILFSATPAVSPVFVAGRSKGRLDHALRSAGIEMPFSRKVAVRSIGDNTRRDVEAYLERQVVKERFDDKRFAAMLADLTIVHRNVDLSQPAESARGRYWYNMHLVLVVQDRLSIGDRELLRTIRVGCGKVAAKKGHLISRLSLLPDQLHIALRPRIDESPLDVVHAYQNNLAYIAGQQRIWCEGFYVGTFSEYTTQAVRQQSAASREN